MKKNQNQPFELLNTWKNDDNNSSICSYIGINIIYIIYLIYYYIIIILLQIILISSC